MKNILFLVFFIISSVSFAQNKSSEKEKTSKIVKTYWVVGGKKVKQIEEYQTNLVSLFVVTKNIPESEEITVTVEEADNSYSDRTKREVLYTGKVKANGIAELQRKEEK